jgi:hypothetical protein
VRNDAKLFHRNLQNDGADSGITELYHHSCKAQIKVSGECNKFCDGTQFAPSEVKQSKILASSGDLYAVQEKL